MFTVHSHGSTVHSIPTVVSFSIGLVELILIFSHKNVDEVEPEVTIKAERANRVALNKLKISWS